MSQGVLPFQLDEKFSRSGVTALAGLPTYLELGHVLGLGASIEEHLCARSGEQGYTDAQVVVPLVLMNLAGGDCVADLERLEDDPGFRRLYERVELSHLPRKKRRQLRSRWRKKKRRLVPSASSVFRYLEKFCVEEEKTERGYGQSYVPPVSKALHGLRLVNQDLLKAVYSRNPLQSKATLDLDATVKEVQKDDALCSYKSGPAYQPLNVWWDEQELMVHSEFRDGNVSACFENLRVLKESLEMLPEGVNKVAFRSDTAAYQKELLQFLAKGRSKRFGVIDFAVGVPIEKYLRREIRRLEEEAWQPLLVQDKKTKVWKKSCYEWAEVVFVPNWVAHKKSNPEYRFIVTREALSQQPLAGLEEQLELPFSTTELAGTHYKLYVTVTNLDWSGDEVIRWYRKRCGKSEQVHSTMKSELAGSQLPSGKFGVNAAWWAIMILALNLNSAMKQLVLAPALGKRWARKRLKAIRYHIINLPGRIVNHARELWIKIGGTAALSRLRDIRTRIAALA